MSYTFDNQLALKVRYTNASDKIAIQSYRIYDAIKGT